MTTTATKPLIQNIDYVINGDGDLVFTSSYLLKRGHCCQSGCLNCPYNYQGLVDPSHPSEFSDSWAEAFEPDQEESDDND